MEQSYKEKYEQAIERLKQWDREHPCAGYVLSDRDKFIFPELAESEGEKVIKEIIELVMQPTWKTEEEFHRRNVLCAWLENVPVTIDHEKREGFHLGYKACLEKQGEQKPAEWSKLNEEVLDALIRRLEGEDIYVSPHLAVECLKSLKGRVHPKQEWSEEDEQHIDSLLKRLDALCRNKFERTRFAISEDRDWLKSLRPQNNITDEELTQAKKNAYNDALDKIEYHSGEPTFDDGWSAAIDYIRKKSIRPQNRWKPSDVQMGCLSDAIEHYNSLGYPAHKLKELLDDLKKIKGKV